MNLKARIAWLVALFLSILTACGGGGTGPVGGGGIGGTGSPSTAGTVRVFLADAPACGYDAVFVTVRKVRLHQSANASDGDGGWSEVVLDPAKRVDLLTLTNGVLEDLGQTALPPGKYTQLRLILADNDSADPLANAVVPTGGRETALDTANIAQGGIKVNADIDVAAGAETGLVLDFDACKSVVRRGNSNRYGLKPVVTALPRTSEPGLRVTGYVGPAMSTASTNVSLQSAGVPVRATHPDRDGRFVLYPVPTGTYDLVVTADGRTTAVMTGVPVTGAQPTTIGSQALPIDPPAAAMRNVSGTVIPASATVRALQTLDGGTTVEVGWAPVDATTGAFAFALPMTTTVTTRYVAGATSSAFAPDPAVALRYTIEASTPQGTQTRSIDVLGAVPPLSFTLP